MGFKTKDSDYDTANQAQNGGNDWVVSGTVNVDGGNGGIRGVNAVAIPDKVTITPAAGAANVCNVTFQVTDAAGNALAACFNFDVWLSDDATAGAGQTATSASGTVTPTTGAVVETQTAKKALRVQSDATGKVVLAITDTAKTLFVPCAQVPGTGSTVVGAALVTGNYG